MEIYNYADLGGMHSWDFTERGITPKDEGIEPIAVTDKPLEMGSLLIIEGTAYTICAMSGKGGQRNVAYVEKLKNQTVFIDGEEPKEQMATDEITCPYCGGEVANSWECDDSDEHYECPCCGSYFSYERHVIVTYWSSPEEINTDKIII